MGKIVSNTTPIIALASINRLELLEVFYKEVIIPNSVRLEIETGGKLLVPKISSIKYLKVVDDIKKVENSLLYGLGEGEKQALLTGLNYKAEKVILDERKARKIGIQLGLSIVGTIGVLARGRKEKIIKNFKTEAYKLIENGLYYDLELIDEISRKID